MEEILVWVQGLKYFMYIYIEKEEGMLFKRVK